MNNLPRYEKYKDSGVDWLEDVPEHWRIGKFGRFYTLGMGETILASDLQDNGLYPVLSATEEYRYFGFIDTPRLILEPGDLVIPARGNSIGHVKIVKSRCQNQIIAVTTDVLDIRYDPLYFVKEKRNDQRTLLQAFQRVHGSIQVM